MSNELKREFSDLLFLAEALDSEVGVSVADLLREGLDNPLPREELTILLSKIVTVLREEAGSRGDESTVNTLDNDIGILIEKAEGLHEHFFKRPASQSSSKKETESTTTAKSEEKTKPGYLPLQSHDGIEPSAVLPKPVFHERSVAVNEGFVRSRDIQLWNENERLDIQLNQFHQKYGRQPSASELVDIMKGTMPLPGIAGQDQFSIVSLAKSIAVNGVRKPPIIDLDGTLLDGNRRLAACYHILDDTTGEFTLEEKKRAEVLKVWQLTEHATQDDRDAVIVSLNFEPDHKEDWPQYVKARKVYEYWESLANLETLAATSAARVKQITQLVARRFALATNEVTRYRNMVTLAIDFETYHVEERSRDKFETKHVASDKFQYFDELNKGKSEGGLFWCLNQDDGFKHLVYDLLFDGKFRNWQQIRLLKWVYNDGEALDGLKKARDTQHVESAQNDIEDSLSLARTNRAETRQLGANKRIQSFTKWFRELPLKAFDPTQPGCIDTQNLRQLQKTLQRIESLLSNDPSDT